MKNIFKFLILVASPLAIIACTDLVELPLDGVTPTGGASAKSELKTVLGSVAGITNEWNRFVGLNEMPSDAVAGPTRGGDWDDNAALRQIHAHTWGPDHPWIAANYNILLTGIYNSDLILNNTTQSSLHPQVKFLKSWFYYEMIDKYGQVPYRASYVDLTKDALVYTRTQAFAEALRLAEEALAALPEPTADAETINKNTARFLLAKLHLNRAVFTGAAGATTFTFDAADMTAVIRYVNEMTAVGLLNLPNQPALSYWTNFAANNDTSPEIIFSLKANVGNSGNDHIGSVQYYWRMGMHYNMTPDGWNGPVMVGEYYDKFLENGVAEGADPRATYSTPDIVTRLGNPVGVIRGQVLKPGGTEKVLDRKGNDLIFTKNVDLVIFDPVAIESAGYRTIKYIPDAGDISNPGNDFVLYRYADAILMSAEASLRGGTGGDAAVILNTVRARVGLGAIPATLDNVYAERARELWLEGWRRNDMIRFGKFLDTKALKPAVSDKKYLLYSLPADALINPNLKQNPGY